MANPGNEFASTDSSIQKNSLTGNNLASEQALSRGQWTADAMKALNTLSSELATLNQLLPQLNLGDSSQAANSPSAAAGSDASTAASPSTAAPSDAGTAANPSAAAGSDANTAANPGSAPSDGTGSGQAPPGDGASPPGHHHHKHHPHSHEGSVGGSTKLGEIGKGYTVVPGTTTPLFQDGAGSKTATPPFFANGPIYSNPGAEA